MFALGVLGLCLAQAPPFGPPTLSSGTLLTNQAVATLDVNRDGSPELFSVGPLGLNFLVSTDEDGALLKSAQLGWWTFPTFPANTVPFVLAVGAGLVTADNREDLVLVSSSGAVMLYANSGGHAVDATAFAPGMLIDFFGPSLPLNPPFVKLSVPNVSVIDANHDGLMDILVAGAPVDIWTAQTLPGFLKLYVATSAGTFQIHSLTLPGNVVDSEWADLDGDGIEDAIVVVVEQGAVGNFSYELHHAAFDAVQGLHFLNAPQPLAPRVTSLEVADVLGGPAVDYVFSLSAGSSSVMAIEGNGAGQLIYSSWRNVALPPNPTTLPAYILSVQIEDFDRDGNNDLAAVRHFLQPAPAGSVSAPQVANAELLVAMGPNLQWGPVTSIDLGGYVSDSWTVQPSVALLPLVPTPDLIRVADWSRDRAPDLFIASLMQSTPTTVSKIAVLKNSSSPTFGRPGLFKLGHPSGGASGYPARAGFDGLPILSNSQFGATISNLRGGSLAGLVWSTVAAVDLFHEQGVDVHIAPVAWLSPFVVSGTGAGQGFGFHALPVPNDPLLLGDLGYFQWGYFDPVAGAFGGTQATQVFVAAQ